MESIFAFTAFIFHYGVLILFGVYNSAAFIGVWRSRRDTILLFFVSVVLSALQIGVLFLRDSLDDVMYFYPLITHVPLAAFFVIYYQRRGKDILTVFLSIVMAYFCCQISNWFGIVASTAGASMAVVDIVIGLMLLITWYFLFQYFANTISQLINRSLRSTLIIGMLPSIYYCYDYISVVYSDLLYSANMVTVEFLPFILCLSFLLFVFLYYKEYEQRLDAENQTQMLRMQATQYEALQNRMEETRRARHDLRQHLRLIQTYLDKGDEDALRDYIHSYGMTLPEDTCFQFCENHVADAVVRFYALKAAENHVPFHASLHLPANMNIAEPDLCVLLGNLLENALEECSRHDAKTCFIKLNGQLRGSRTLIITVDNGPAFQPKYLGDHFLSTKGYGREGVGMLSVRNIAARYNGEATFEWRDHAFYASIILTLPVDPLLPPKGPSTAG